MWVTLLSSKDQEVAAIKKVQAAAKRKSGNLLRVLTTDRGGEFTVNHFQEYCVELRIRHEMTTPYSPQ
jgi:transposase InsO family protein